MRRERRISVDEGIEIPSVREIQSALAGEQELAADGGHCIEQINTGPGRDTDLSGHQSGGTATNNRNAQSAHD